MKLTVFKLSNCSNKINRLIFVICALCSITHLNAQTWQPLGPSPLEGGGSEGITNRPVSGAIHAIATHPSNPDVLYIASVNGGIWKTTNGTAANPTWLPITDDQPSTSMGDIEFDPTDVTNNTLVAGFARFSSLASFGGDRAGVIRTTDGGTNWASIGMQGRNIASVKARGATLLAASNSGSCANRGIFRSTDTGTIWNKLGNSQNIASGIATALVSDPSDNSTFYAGIAGGCGGSFAGGIYKSTDLGANWAKVSDASMESVISSNNCNFRIGVGSNDNVYVGMVCSGGDLDAVFRSGNGGTSWTQMAIPITNENSGPQGIHPGTQGSLHFSLTADPNNDNIVYIGGDRQPDAFLANGSGSQFPNSIGANNYSGRIFRGDASQPLATQWVPLTHNGTGSNTAPHADSRELRFDSNGTLYQSDDGGLYRHTTPTTTTGDWTSVNGSLQVGEQHNMSYDTVSSIVFTGNQDNGTGQQNLFASTTWSSIGGGDGGDVVVDVLALAGSNQSIRYRSSQNFGGARRFVFDENNNIVSTASLSLTVVSAGDPLQAQFITPIASNNVEGNRLIIGGGNSVYESTDLGDTITEIGDGIVVNGFAGNTIAYGAAGNPDILYIGSGDEIYVRTTSGAGALNLSTTSAGQIQGVVVNPADPSEAFYADTTKVFHTTNTGTSWNDITGGLTGFGQIRTIEFMPFADSGLAIGSNSGVFVSRASGNYSSWNDISTGMPNAPIFDLSYDASTDRLVAGTLGRGAFALNGVLGGNTPPTVVNDNLNVAKGGTVSTVSGGSTSLLNNDSDADGDNITMQTTAVSEPSNGVVTLNANGTFSYQHGDSFTNADQFFYRVCDDGTPSLCADGQVDVAIDLGSAICSNPNISIPDGDSVTGVTDSLNVVSTGAITDLNVSVEATHTWVGDLTFTLTHVDTGTQVVIIDRPGVPASGNGCNQDDISALLDDEASANAEDQCTSPSPPGIAIGGTLIPNNLLSTFDGEDITGNWTLKVTDSVNIDSGALISWCLVPTTSGTSNSAPVLANIGTQSVDELSELTFTATATDADNPAQSLTFSLNGEPTGATITSGGEFSFTPTEAQGPGTYNFDVIVTDNGAGNLSDSETITVTVNEVNLAPVLASIGNQTVEELSTLNFTATATDSDVPAQSLSFSLSGEPTGATITQGGEFSFTPTEAQGPGSYNFDVIVTDNGAGNLSDSENITVTVNENNTAPTLGSIGNQTVEVLTTLSFTATATDVDIPTQSLTFSLSGEPSGASITTGGVFSFTPTVAQGETTYSFTVIVTDSGTGNLTDSEMISISVTNSDIIYANGFEVVP